MEKIEKKKAPFIKSPECIENDFEYSSSRLRSANVESFPPSGILPDEVSSPEDRAPFPELVAVNFVLRSAKEAEITFGLAEEFKKWEEIGGGRRGF